MPVEFHVSEFTLEELIEMAHVLPPHHPLHDVIFAEIQRLRGGPVAPAPVRRSQRLAAVALANPKNARQELS